MSTPTTTDTEIRCVCAAALERARALYGHMEGQDVWITRASDPHSSYRGVLGLPADQPGFVHVDRGGERDRWVHIDDVLALITHAEHEARARARYGR